MKIESKEQGAIVIADVVELIGGKWRALIIAKLCDQPRRFNELKSELSKITSSTLTKELRHLEDLKIIDRQIVNERPIAVEYRLSEHGKSLKPLIVQIINWGLEHRKRVLEG